MELWLPLGYHLNIVTRKRIAQWDVSGLVDVFQSSGSSIVAASETPENQRILAIANGRIIMLHDLWQCKTGKRHRLGNTVASVQLLAFGHFQDLYFTVQGFDFVFGYSLSKDKIDRKVELLSAATTLAVSKTYLLVSCAEESQIVIVALQTQKFWRFAPNASDSPIKVTSFHPNHSSIFAVADKSGTLTINDTARLAKPGQKPLHSPLGTIADLHGGCFASSQTAIVALAFVPAFPARIVTVGGDRRGHLVDLTEGAHILSTWDLGCLPTSVAVLTVPTSVPPSDGAQDFRALVAVGRADGRVSISDNKGLLSQNIVVDLQSTKIISVEWRRGPISHESTQNQDTPYLHMRTTRRPSRLRSGPVWEEFLTSAKGSFHLLKSQALPTFPKSSTKMEDVSTSKASKIWTRRESPLSKRSSIASFSSALSHIRTPSVEPSNETIVIKRLSDLSGDFGFADVDATRIYTKPKRPQTARRSRLLQPAARVGHTEVDTDWQTIQLTSLAKQNDKVNGQDECMVQTTPVDETISPADATALPESHIASLTSWSRFSDTPPAAISPPRTNRQRRPPLGFRSLASASINTKDSAISLRRSVPLDRTMAALLHKKPSSSSSSTPLPVEPVLHRSLAENATSTALAASFGPVTQSSTPPNRSKSEAPSRIHNQAVSTEKPLPMPPVTPSSSPPVLSQSKVDEKPTYSTCPSRLDMPKDNKGDEERHLCPCNCAILASINRLEAQISMLNDRLVITEHKARRHTHRDRDAREISSQPLSSDNIPMNQSENGEGWMRVGRFLVRRAEESKSSWRRRTRRRTRRVLHRQLEVASKD